MGDEKRRRGYSPPAAFPLLPPTEPIEHKGGSFFKSSSFSEAALQHLHDVLPGERNGEGFKRRKPVLLDALGKARKAVKELRGLLKEIAQKPRREERQTDAVRDVVLDGVAGPARGLRAESSDAVAAERARPEKFGSGVKVAGIFEHDRRVVDHRAQDAFDETFGDGRDVLHEVLFHEVAHGVAGARNGLASGNRNRIGRIDEGDDGPEQVARERKLLVGLDVRDDRTVVVFAPRGGDGVDRHEGQGIGDETVVEHEIPGGTVMSGRRADRLRGVHHRAAAHGNHEIHAFSATEGSGAVNRRHARIGFDARNLDGANARSFKSLEDCVERPVAAHTAAARDDERRFTAA